jgi:hypothetical protein
MKCSKCGGEIKNLPEYIEETQTEIVCTKCAGYSEQGESSVVILDRFHTFRGFSRVSEEVEIAA